MPDPVQVPRSVDLAGGALRPGPDQARAWLERELSRPEYQVSLLDRFASWLSDLWRVLQAGALGASSLSTGAAVVLVALLLALALTVVGRARREPGRRAAPTAELGSGRASAGEHRAAAEAALASGALGDVIVEGFRAVAARAVERGVLEERGGRTARELTDELSPAYPAHTPSLRRASASFDSVFYGAERATEPDARAVLDLDDALRGARPLLTVPGSPADPAVPR